MVFISRPTRPFLEQCSRFNVDRLSPVLRTSVCLTPERKVVLIRFNTCSERGVNTVLIHCSPTRRVQHSHERLRYKEIFARHTHLLGGKPDNDSFSGDNAIYKYTRGWFAVSSQFQANLRHRQRIFRQFFMIFQALFLKGQ